MVLGTVLFCNNESHESVHDIYRNKYGSIYRVLFIHYVCVYIFSLPNIS